MQAKQTTIWTWAQQAYMFFDKVKDVWHLKMASCNSPCIKLATYKLRL